MEKKIRQEGLLSDEEAQEVVRLLSPKDKPDVDWLNTSGPTSLLNESITSTTHDESSIKDMNESADINSITGSMDGSGVTSLDEIETDDMENSNNLLEYSVPLPGRIIMVENGVHYYEDGHFWMEVPGLHGSDEEDDDDLGYPVFVKKSSRVVFSTGPMKVYSTHSVSDYDRRNEDVDPVAASAEYELEKRVEKMDVFPVELIKGPEGLGLSIIGKCFLNKHSRQKSTR